MVCTVGSFNSSRDNIGAVLYVWPPSFRLAEAGHEVVGVEFSELAVKEFFTKNSLPFEHEQVGKLVRYKVSLVCCILHWSGVLCIIFTTHNSICNFSSLPILSVQMCQGRWNYGKETCLNVLGM